MSVRVHGNQHGHFVKLDGHHLLLLQSAAAKHGVSEEEMFDRIISEYAERALSPLLAEHALIVDNPLATTLVSDDPALD